MKERLDERVARDGLAETRSRAQRLIMAGVVRVDGVVVDKAGTAVAADAVVSVDAPARFVSRGGEKLDNAFVSLDAVLDEHGLSVNGVHALDVGASTGGFTDCLLQRGAAHVTAVDVGHGQLHPKLREDPRVTVLERTNARTLTPEQFDPPPSLLVCDASFISLRTVLAAPVACMASGWWGLVLCKPQFEAGRERLHRYGRKGVITDDAGRALIVDECAAQLRGIGIDVRHVVQAHPPGPKGNIEFVFFVRALDTES